jgi:hypothetical protein
VTRREKWLALTAGIGTEDFEGAAKRVRNSLLGFRNIDKAVAVLTSEISEICPITSNLYSEIMNTHTRGYGYMCWKAEIIKAGFEGYWGDYDGVIWVDAGCEVFRTPITQVRFRLFQSFSRRHGVACFTLDTKEIEYTKRDLFDRFPGINPKKAGKQIQTTWMFLHGQQGREISKQWFDLVVGGKNLLDLTPSLKKEYPEFIENRYDQSTFSLVCKHNRVAPMRYRPTGGTRGRLAILRSFFHPIWTTRNRTEQSAKNRIHLSVEKLFPGNF